MKKTRITLVIDCFEEHDCPGVTVESIRHDHDAVLEWARDITGDYDEAEFVSATVEEVDTHSTPCPVCHDDTCTRGVKNERLT